MFQTLFDSVLPEVPKKYPAKVQFLFRQQIQPWHPSSTLVHEAGAAVLRLAPDKFWPFSKALFENQKDFFDVNVVHEARNDTYKRLAKLAGSLGLDESKVFDLLEISDKPGEGGSLNTGNKVTDDVKLMVKVSLPVVIWSKWVFTTWRLGKSTGRRSRNTNSSIQCKWLLLGLYIGLAKNYARASRREAFQAALPANSGKNGWIRTSDEHIRKPQCSILVQRGRWPVASWS